MQVLITVIAIIALVIVLIVYLSNFAFRLALTRGDEKLQKKLPGKLQDYPNNGWIDANTKKIVMESDLSISFLRYSNAAQYIKYSPRLYPTTEWSIIMNGLFPSGNRNTALMRTINKIAATFRIYGIR